MTDFISNLIGNNIVATIIMSLVPLIELKGGIIYARGAGLGTFEALGLAYLGSTIVFIPIFFLLIPILNGLKKIKWFNKLACKAENFVQTKANDVLTKRQEKNKSSKMSETLLKQICVFVFVAIPLPLTGVWMGTAIAVFLGMKFKDTILPITIGNLVAGGLITGLVEICMLCTGSNIALTKKILDIILYALFAIAVLGLIITIVKVVKQKPKNVTEQSETNEILSDMQTANETQEKTDVELNHPVEKEKNNEGQE